MQIFKIIISEKQRWPYSTFCLFRLSVSYTLAQPPTYSLKPPAPLTSPSWIRHAPALALINAHTKPALHQIQIVIIIIVIYIPTQILIGNFVLINAVIVWTTILKAPTPFHSVKLHQVASK